MITLKKLRVYQGLHGDIDMYSRMYRNGEESGITNEDWRNIDVLVQRLKIVLSGQASAEYDAETRAKLEAVTDGDEVRNEILMMAKPPGACR
jgi:hypothetical protein